MTSSNSISSIAPEVLLNGTALPANYELTGLRVKTNLNLPGRTTLRFNDPGYAISAGQSFTVGAQIEVRMAQGESLFVGEVTGIDMELDHGVPDFVITADDQAYKLALGSMTRTFTNVSYSDVVRQIVGEAGLTANVDATQPVFDYVLQSDSNFGFISELADRIGFDWWVEGRSLNFKKPVTSAESAVLDANDDLHQFSVRASAIHPTSTKVHGWAPKTKQSIVGTSATPASNLLPDANLVAAYARPTALQSLSAVTSSTELPLGQSEADQLADRAAAAWATAAVTARGTTVIAPGIKIGGSVRIEGAGPANGKYFVTEVEHTYTDRGFETRFTAGDRRPSALVDTLAVRKATSFRRDGLVVGVVTQIGNPNGSPGEVQVKYPGVDDQLASGWARIATVGGGQSTGVTFMPEINDEVIVGFENGDTRRPVVLGALFNGRDAQPAFELGADKKVGSRQITSRLGHAVEFGDGQSPDKQYISLTLAGGATSVMMSKEKFAATVPTGIPLSITAGSSNFTIAKDGSITIAGKKITIKADTDVEISGLNVTSKASVKNAISGVEVEVTGSAKVDVSASGPASVKGNPVMVN